MQPPREQWQSPQEAQHYRAGRWQSARKRARDPRLVEALLMRYAASRGGLLLDAPCGAGRLLPTLSRHGRVVGLDASAAMLAAAKEATPETTALVLGDALRLPFQDGVFDAVVCCRLLHHFDSAEAFERVVGELVRVSRALVIASFWDAHALPALWQRHWPTGRRARRFTRSRAEVAATLAHAGATVLGWEHSFRFLSRQTFVAARKRAP